MTTAQLILDCYPDAVSEFGLIGCALATAWSAAAVAFVLALVSRR